MYIKKNKNSDNNENNIFWVTMTDLMTALVLVFIVLFFYTYMVSYNDKIEQVQEQQKAAEELRETLQERKIDAQIDSISGIVKISDLELFDLNSYELSQKGKDYLSKFAPAYLDSIFSNEYLNDNIDKIIIQGHTDSQTFAGKYSDDEQYMKNMELSLKRAYAVANYMTNTPYNKANGNRLRKMIVVEGASFSNPVLTQGKEDYAKSRRVELKIIMKEKSSFRDMLNKEE
jgi:chemotaxis protein MotB